MCYACLYVRVCAHACSVCLSCASWVFLQPVKPYTPLTLIVLHVAFLLIKVCADYYTMLTLIELINAVGSCNEIKRSIIDYHKNGFGISMILLQQKLVLTCQ